MIFWDWKLGKSTKGTLAWFIWGAVIKWVWKVWSTRLLWDVAKPARNSRNLAGVQKEMMRDKQLLDWHQRGFFSEILAIKIIETCNNLLYLIQQVWNQHFMYNWSCNHCARVCTKQILVQTTYRLIPHSHWQHTCTSWQSLSSVGWLQCYTKTL